jgi:hypothetical protein
LGAPSSGGSSSHPPGSLAATQVGATLDGSDLVTRSMSDHHDHDDRDDHPEGTWKIEGFDASP